MSDNRIKYISDNPTQKSVDFPKIYDNLDVNNLKLILDKQPNLVLKTDEKTGLTLLFRAVINGNFEMTEYLLERFSDPNVTNIYGETPLHHAVENSNYKLINLLLEKRADANFQQIDGETPMHIAALLGDYKVVKLLHIYGGDPTIRTLNMGYTPLDYAAERNHQKCIEVIHSILEKIEMYNNNHTGGLQTTKNSDSPIHRFRNYANMTPDINNFFCNNTSKHSRNHSNIKNSIDPKHLPFSPSSVNSQLKDLRHLDDKTKRNRFNSCNFGTNYESRDPKFTILNTESSFLNQMNNFEERLEKIKQDLLENVISNTDVIMNEEDTNSKNYKPSQFSNHHKTNSSSSSKDKIPKSSNKVRHAKKYGYSSASVPAFLNYETLIDTHNNRKLQSNNTSHRRDDKNQNTVINHTFKEDATFTFNIEDNRMITLRPEDDSLNANQNIDFIDEVNTTRISYKNQPIDENDDVYNMPLNRNYHKTQNRNSNVKYSENLFNEIEGKSPACKTKSGAISEPFIDYNKVLAIFMSKKNDINEENLKLSQTNENGFNQNLKKSSNMKEEGEFTNQKYSELFNFNLKEMNEFILNTEYKIQSDNEEDEDEEKFVSNFLDNHHQEEQQEINVKKFNLPLNKIDNNNTEPANMVKYFSQSHRSIKEEFKQICLDTQTIDGNAYSQTKLDKNVVTTAPSSNPMNVSTVDFESKDAKEIEEMLRRINLEEHTHLFIKNGFDDLKLIVEQMKSDSAITDENLKDIGIKLPGHRAKILIKLEDECLNFSFTIPLNAYHNIKDKNTDLSSDECYRSLESWLNKIKMQNYISNFISNGYHSLDLLFLQMNSK